MRQWRPRYQLLRAGHLIALQHQADNPALAACDLTGNVPRDNRLASMVFTAVGMAAIDHHVGPKSGLFEPATRITHRLGGVVDDVPPAAKDHETIRIAGGCK